MFVNLFIYCKMIYGIKGKEKNTFATLSQNEQFDGVFVLVINSEFSLEFWTFFQLFFVCGFFPVFFKNFFFLYLTKTKAKKLRVLIATFDQHFVDARSFVDILKSPIEARNILRLSHLHTPMNAHFKLVTLSMLNFPNLFALSQQMW